MLPRLPQDAREDRGLERDAELVRQLATERLNTNESPTIPHNLCARSSTVQFGGATETERRKSSTLRLQVHSAPRVKKRRSARGINTIIRPVALLQ